MARSLPVVLSLLAHMLALELRLARLAALGGHSFAVEHIVAGLALVLAAELLLAQVAVLGLAALASL